MLFRSFNIKIHAKYVNTHTSVYLNVALKEAIAGGGVQKTLSQQRPELKNLLRVLYKTRATPPHPFAAHPRVTESLRKQIQSSFFRHGRVTFRPCLITKYSHK